jgi:hypothetical protein
MDEAEPTEWAASAWSIHDDFSAVAYYLRVHEKDRCRRGS